MVKPKYEVEKRTQTTPFLVKNSVFLSENGQSAHEFQTQIQFLPIWTFSLCASFLSAETSETESWAKKRERAHAWVPFPIQTWRTHWKPMQKIVIKAGNEFYVCGRACDVSNPLRNFQSSPGYLAFFFAFDWLLALELCLHTHPFVVYYWNGTLAPRVKKNWTPVILTFHHPPKCENALFFVQTEAVVEQPTQIACERKEAMY